LSEKLILIMHVHQESTQYWAHSRHGAQAVRLTSSSTSYTMSNHQADENWNLIETIVGWSWICQYSENYSHTKIQTMQT